eukprot:scaffold1638_cov258-Pinguiococcus_pyrenoidosus.AAC.11
MKAATTVQDCVYYVSRTTASGKTQNLPAISDQFVAPLRLSALCGLLKRHQRIQSLFLHQWKALDQLSSTKRLVPAVCEANKATASRACQRVFAAPQGFVSLGREGKHVQPGSSWDQNGA